MRKNGRNISYLEKNVKKINVNAALTSLLLSG